MFTGLVEALGQVRSAVRKGSELHLEIVTPFEGIVLGESISVNGTCLTVNGIPAPKTFTAYASKETLDRTTLADIRTSSSLNLERALLPTTRLGGHIVTGHVDGIGIVRAKRIVESAVEFEISHDAELTRFIAEKGSIAVDGVSLTVNRVTNDSFFILIIPHTQTATTIGSLDVRARVNLEVDVLARYAARILQTADAKAEGWARLLAPEKT